LSYWFFQTLWEKDGWSGNNWSGDTLAPRQDIRNAPCNIVRDFKVRNSASDYNGQWVLKDNLPAVLSGMEDTIRNFYPWVMKTSTPEDKWPGAWVEDPIVEGEINDSRHNFRDDYEIRLAETYLLRAEAYLRNDNPSAAAADINVVRNRAKAPLIGNPGYISEGDLDIDYILDERARELHLEESRLLLLARMGKLVERANATVPSHRYESHNNLWPIPYSEIEKNTGNELEQNPDY